MHVSGSLLDPILGEFIKLGSSRLVVEVEALQADADTGLWCKTPRREGWV